MTHITLNLPDELAATLAAMPEDERDHFATAALSAAIDDENEELTQEELSALAGPLTPEDMAAIARGLAEADAGLGRPADDFFAELRQELKAGDIKRRGS